MGSRSPEPPSWSQSPRRRRERNASVATSKIAKARSPTSSCSSSRVFWALKGKRTDPLTIKSRSRTARRCGSRDTSKLDRAIPRSESCSIVSSLDSEKTRSTASITASSTSFCDRSRIFLRSTCTLTGGSPSLLQLLSRLSRSRCEKSDDEAARAASRACRSRDPDTGSDARLSRSRERRTQIDSVSRARRIRRFAHGRDFASALGGHRLASR